MRFAVASDHAGFELKEFVKQRLFDYGHEVVDFGTDTASRPCDYPDKGRPAAQAVARGNCDFAVLVCGTGIGMSIVANKVPGIYAALCTSGVQAEYSRRHNNANVLVMGGWLTGRLMAEDILDRWLKAEFENGRHGRRVGKVENGM
ncbi:MAG: ribose 5-phosphate isomerase B [Candidatus Hatepunaea meridiana]|nr:ribose 5-phosphate isomerase B [Candidatus Hatepunaea meridiana]